MYFVRLLFLFLTAACLLFLMAGLYKPWVMLWWEDTQNRKKILQVYGTLMIVFYAFYHLLKFIKT